MLNKLQKREQGFTIIEVLIVLAIAGLIMLIVFLAVPALQRNSRNTGRRNDIARFAAAVNDFISNNNGTLPTDTQTSTAVTNMGNLNQFAAADRLTNASGAQAVIATVGSSSPQFRLVTGAQCGTSGATVAGSTRQAAVQYQLETSSSTVFDAVCLNI